MGQLGSEQRRNAREQRAELEKGTWWDPKREPPCRWDRVRNHGRDALLGRQFLSTTHWAGAKGARHWKEPELGKEETREPSCFQARLQQSPDWNQQRSLQWERCDGSFHKNIPGRELSEETMAQARAKSHD